MAGSRINIMIGLNVVLPTAAYFTVRVGELEEQGKEQRKAEFGETERHLSHQKHSFFGGNSLSISSH